MTPIGRVAIVGAGPGDPELITVRGLARIRSADVLVYDRLVAPELLTEAPAEAERIFAGKAKGYAALTQRQIEAVLIERARAGKQVVRLKGGDPYLFGRGGEEVAALIAAGISVELVPGISSALAVPAAAGIPVTHRDHSSALTVVTGHEDPAKTESSLDWPWLAAAPGTVVILMGLSQLPQITKTLLAHGRAADTPAAVIAAGTLPEQRVVTAPLVELAAAAQDAQLVSPALVVLGDVVRVRQQLAASALYGLPVDPVPGLDSRREPDPTLLVSSTSASVPGGSNG